MKARNQLPPGYVRGGSLDLSKNCAASILLNGVALALYFLYGWVAFQIFRSLRSSVDPPGSFLPDSGDQAVVFLITVALVLIVHELIHGLFFWIFTRDRPKFGFRGVYAYACAPDWYLPRNPYLVVGLAPILAISLLGLALAPLLSSQAVRALLYAVSLNAAGSTGDLFVVGWLLTMPTSTLINDLGDGFTIYIPSEGIEGERS